MASPLSPTWELLCSVTLFCCPKPSSSDWEFSEAAQKLLDKKERQSRGHNQSFILLLKHKLQLGVSLMTEGGHHCYSPQNGQDLSGYYEGETVSGDSCGTADVFQLCPDLYTYWIIYCSPHPFLSVVLNLLYQALFVDTNISFIQRTQSVTDSQGCRSDSS